MFVLLIKSPHTREVRDSFHSMLTQPCKQNAAVNTVFLMTPRGFSVLYKVPLGYSLPMYLGIQRTDGGRPLILKCLPSN